MLYQDSTLCFLYTCLLDPESFLVFLVDGELVFIDLYAKVAYFEVCCVIRFVKFLSFLS